MEQYDLATPDMDNYAREVREVQGGRKVPRECHSCGRTVWEQWGKVALCDTCHDHYYGSEA